MLPDFNDGKDPGALRTIGEVSRALSIRQHVLRYWEEQFPTLRPVKRSGGRRYYRPEDIALIREINRLVHGEGYTLKGAKAALGVTAPTRPSPRVSRTQSVGESSGVAAGEVPVEELRAIRNDLAEALARA